MEPIITGKKYDKIANIWHRDLDESEYGLKQIKRAIEFCPAEGKKALDVGCGCGGRVIRLLEGSGFSVCGFDVSEKMVEIARTNHPLCDFKVADATTLEIEENYDLIIAWDSIFHLPLDQHFPVIQKLSSKLNTNGVLLYTFGDAQGEHTDTWHNDEFYYSSMGINRNLMLLMECGLKIVHLVLDQLPNNHVTVMAKRTP